MTSRLAVCLALAASALLSTECAALAQNVHTSLHHSLVHHRRVLWDKPGVAPLAAAPASRIADGTSPAPIPNEWVSPPDSPAPEAQIAPSSFQLHYPPVGEGYVTGSSPQAMDDREAAKATGVLMTVPLSQ